MKLRTLVSAVLLAAVLLAPAAGPAQAGPGHRHHARAGRHHHKKHSAGLRAPALDSPADNATVQQLPAFTWSAVHGAAEYEYQVAADRSFSSIVGTGLSEGAGRTHNLAAALEKTVPDGAYYWRVRALTAADRTGPWSRARRVVKAWTDAPRITGGDEATVDWPATPLVLRWSSVPYATKYVVSIATDPGLSNVVLGTATRPTETQGTSFALPVSLSPGVYYWAVTPVDAEGRHGTESRVATFTWAWPTTTTTNVTDLNPDPRVFEPIFSWVPVPGAARYEVEVSSAEGFPAGSKWCCSDTTTGTSLTPLQVLANNTYYWRVRAIDARGNAGVWNYGQPFTKAFDSVTPSVPGLTMRDVAGNALTGAPETSTPIVTWEPVPGASLYEVQLGIYDQTKKNCNWSRVSQAGYHAETATTAWTPLARTSLRPYSKAWPAPQTDASLETGPEHSYCVRVLARSDDDAQHKEVTSEWTYLNGHGNPAFTFTGSPAGSSSCQAVPVYRLPADGSVTTRTPYFTWEAVPGAASYFVVVSRDAGFTDVVDVGFTDVNAYAPRLGTGVPLSDETTAYYWAVIPATSANGENICSEEAVFDNPQSFDKSSVPPEPIAPAEGAGVSTQPTFRWSAAENARNYQLQVSQDPTFGNPIDDVTTDATAYTSSSTYPANATIYWRVRANDWNKQGLKWSPTRRFVRTLPAPSPVAGSASGEGIPPFSWTPVQGAISYDVHVEEGDGTQRNFNVESPSFTATTYYGVGIVRLQARAEFPTASFGGKVAGGYSPLQPVLLSLGAPSGAHGVKSGSRLTISWNPDPAAKQYQVEVSTSDGFGTRIESRKVDGTSWAPNIDLTQKSNRGTLYWRVAAVDTHGDVGAFATGSFGKPVHKHKRRCRRVKRKVNKRCAAKRHGKSKRRHH